MPATKSAKSAASAKSGKVRKTRKSNADSYSTYIAKVMKRVCNEDERLDGVIGVTSRGLATMNGLIGNVEGRIKHSALQIAQLQRKQTLSDQHIEAAVRVVMPLELERNAIKAGREAVLKYTASAN